MLLLLPAIYARNWSHLRRHRDHYKTPHFTKKMAVRSQIPRFDAQNAPMLSCCTGNMPYLRGHRDDVETSIFSIFRIFRFFRKQNNHKKLSLGVEKDGFCSINIDFHTHALTLKMLLCCPVVPAICPE